MSYVEDEAFVSDIGGILVEQIALKEDLSSNEEGEGINPAKENKGIDNL